MDRPGYLISKGLGCRAGVPRRLQRAAFLFYKRASLSQTPKKAFKLSLVGTAEVTGVDGYLCYLAKNTKCQVTDLTRHWLAAQVGRKFRCFDSLTHTKADLRPQRKAQMARALYYR